MNSTMFAPAISQRSVLPWLAWAFALSPARAHGVIAAAWLAVACADVVTGRDVWMGPLYLLVICFAAVAAGWRVALATGFAALAVGLHVNGLDLYPYGGSAREWNIVMRILPIAIIIGVLESVRRAFAREWWLARTDPLTQALNRQAFFELADAQRSSPGWTLFAYADLDGLKALNDRHGHAAGDECLKVFAAAVKRMIRPGDIFARIGGDEFLVQMKVPSEDAGRRAAIRLHQSLNGIVCGDGREVRCSIGVLIAKPGARSVDREIVHADRLMYEAKAQGASLRVELSSDMDALFREETGGNDTAPSAWPHPPSPAPSARQPRRKAVCAAPDRASLLH